MIKFYSPIADSSNFPPARIKAKPHVVEGCACSKECIDERERMLFNQGRVSIYFLMSHLSGRRVWVPDYHCPALVEPLLAAGKQVEFYRVDCSLNPVYDSFESKLKSGDICIGIRYFGFTCSLPKLAEVCSRKGVTFVEDLAHAAIYGNLHGDYGFTSLTKFYPACSGSELLVADHEEFVRLSALLHKFPSKFKQQLLSFGNRIADKMLRQHVAKRHKYFSLTNAYKIKVDDISLSLQSMALDEMVRKRRDNYKRMLTAAKISNVGVPLFKSLDSDVVPYVFPFVAKNKNVFDEIRQRGIQILRWEEMAETERELVNHFRGHLLQFPCHQDLDEDSVDFICNLIKGN